MNREDVKKAVEVMQAWLDHAYIDVGPGCNVTLEAWIDEFGELRWVKSDTTVASSGRKDSWTRVSSEDKTVWADHGAK